MEEHWVQAIRTRSLLGPHVKDGILDLKVGWNGMNTIKILTRQGREKINMFPSRMVRWVLVQLFEEADHYGFEH
ncbi:hypothetical protein SESBI_23428 [Sesbania bispinosa]|nr:hypothetical protein SESBI_23428 [Sesbania bispinosa]